MRLYPPAWSLARTVISDFEFRGYRIPAGANVVMSQWIMHRSPTYFPEPEKFDPDRWSPEKAQSFPASPTSLSAAVPGSALDHRSP